ncbi:MAG: helix-turn-helix domain-containing protein [Gammaproteobacteria bacterium]|nr:helix-turn-helix domain-containing protein [Gammaproteobacteria bacterium]
MWLWIGRIAAVLHLTLAARGLHEQRRRDKVEVNPQRIYNSKEAANLLQLPRDEILRQIRSGAIAARLIGEQYRIPGCSLISYLQQLPQDSLVPPSPPSAVTASPPTASET